MANSNAHDFIFDLYTLQDFNAGKSNSQNLTLLTNLLHDIMKQELTERQRLFLTQYYFDGLNMVSIARVHGVNKSTVSRTIKRAKKRVYQHLQYTFNQFR